jgi:hypothetical protein
VLNKKNSLKVTELVARDHQMNPEFDVGSTAQ